MKTLFRVTAKDHQCEPALDIETTYVSSNGSSAGISALIHYYLNRGYDFWLKNPDGSYVLNAKGSKVFDKSHFFAHYHKYIRDLKSTAIGCEADANSENLKEGNPMLILKVAVEVNGKMSEREVYLVHENGMCKGKVGNAAFRWAPAKYELPTLSFTPAVAKKVYAGCNTAEERRARTDDMRRIVKEFLLAYKAKRKEIMNKNQQIHNKTDVEIRDTQLNNIPAGWEGIEGTPFDE